MRRRASTNCSIFNQKLKKGKEGAKEVKILTVKLASVCMPSVAGASKLQEVPGILCEGEGAGDEG